MHNQAQMLWDTGPHVQTISHPHLEVLPGEQVRPEPARVQGNLLVASLRWLAGDRGLPQLAALYRAMPEREQWSLGHVRVDQWYPLRSWETFLQVGDEVLGRGDLALAEALGRGAAHRSLRKVLEREDTPPHGLALPSPFTLLARALRRWRSLTCSAGSWIMTCESRKVASARLADLAIGPAFGRFVAGWLAGHVVSRDGRPWLADLCAPGEYVLTPLCQL